MALFRRNKLSPEWQIWLGPLPNIIPPESGHSSGFQQESVGQGKDLGKANSFNNVSKSQHLFISMLTFASSLNSSAVIAYFKIANFDLTFVMQIYFSGKIRTPFHYLFYK